MSYDIVMAHSPLIESKDVHKSRTIRKDKEDVEWMQQRCLGLRQDISIKMNEIYDLWSGYISELEDVAPDTANQIDDISEILVDAQNGLYLRISKAEEALRKM